MARIRQIEISNFRGIKHLRWAPSPGINCMIGPGDSGKSTILDAIDLCLGARRNAHFSDADFHTLDVTTPLIVCLTVGDLDDDLKSMEGYGLFLRGFDPETGEVADEPEEGAETVLTLQMLVASDLEPSWTLYSDRAASQDVTRGLSWGDRVRLAPTRIGALADTNLGWGRGSVLNRLSEDGPELSAALAKAARDARIAFGDEVEQQLGNALKTVTETAHRLGIPVGEFVRATLSAHDVSFRSGTISLHDEAGVPLASLGTGSIRLLIAGLQRAAARQSTILLVDELEHGLEPHRIKRFLDSLGAKDRANPVQVFATTHSPVAVRELSGDQLYVLRTSEAQHEARIVGSEDAIQSTVRLYPDAFLAPSVLVCEGASEAGLLRGLDQYRVGNKMGLAAPGRRGNGAANYPEQVNLRHCQRSPRQRFRRGLGDPMQAIFGFGQDDLPAWDEVCAYFPVVGELNTPWRWINAGAEALGQWLLETRERLAKGKAVDLRSAPAAVTWVHLNRDRDYEKRLQAARVNPPGGHGHVLIIGDSTSPESQRRFASQTPGAVTVEAVDLRDFVTFARGFDPALPNALETLSEFAETLMTNLGASDLVRRARKGEGQGSRTQAELAAVRFLREPCYRTALDVLAEMGAQGGVRTHRPAVMRACVKALQIAAGGKISFAEAAAQVREQNRLIGRPLPRRAVGSTLLLKGLEAEVAVILDAGGLDRRNLYVAMTRGSKALVVCSETPILNP